MNLPIVLQFGKKITNLPEPLLLIQNSRKVRRDQFVNLWTGKRAMLIDRFLNQIHAELVRESLCPRIVRALGGAGWNQAF